MTTTTHPKLPLIISLRDKALSTDFEAEATTYLEKARSLCTKYGIDAAILDAKPETKSARDNGPIHNGQAKPARKYPCRFGCGYFVQHTIDELNDCAAKARAASATGSAYDAPKAKADPFGFGSWATYDDAPKAKQSRPRSNGSHAYCSHEATKSARAACRKNRGY